MSLIQLVSWSPMTILHSGAETPRLHCISPTTGEKALVDYVIDGDTLILSDNRRVRLIGIDTPEIRYDGRPSEPGAELARDFLRNLLAPGSQIRLIYDQDQQDRHGRTLAHLFLPDDSNVQARILLEGLATPLTIPPNLKFTACYQQQARLAEEQGKGLWAWEKYQPVSITKLPGTERGYRIITGRVIRVADSRSSLWIQLEKNFALRILRNDLPYFDGQNLHALPGETVQARGWIYHRKNEMRMQIRHPADLRIMAKEHGN